MTTTVVPLNNPEGHFRASGSLRSEWTKLHTVRSTVWTLVTLVVASTSGRLGTAARVARIVPVEYSAVMISTPRTPMAI